jgi:DnaJ-class molecular chaperone
MKEYYKILECSPGDSPEEIRKKWRKKCLAVHPDHGGSEEAFLTVMHAYRMITDPGYRMREESRPVRDLTFRIKMIVPFMEAFYGRRLTVSYNRVFLAPDYEPMKTEEIEPITISFDLPAGSCDGFVHTEKEMGMACGRQRGGAEITVISETHPRYAVRGPDVFVDEKIPLDLMLKGGEATVDTLWGHRIVWVPPGTVPKTRLAVPDCGVAQGGFQYCSVSPVYPSRTELKAAKWKGLGINWKKAEDKNSEDARLMKRFEELKKKKLAEEAPA